MKRTAYFLEFLIASMVFCACSAPVQKNENKKTFISTSIDTLGLLIKLDAHPPKKVIYQYTLYDNSAKSRLDFDGPSDVYLEAVLFYDTLPDVNSIGEEVDKENFEFAWLPADFLVLIDKKRIESVNDSVFSINSKYSVVKNAILLKVTWN